MAKKKQEQGSKLLFVREQNKPFVADLDVSQTDDIVWPDTADAERKIDFSEQRSSIMKRSEAQVAYFCPVCQNIDVEIARPKIVDPTKTNGGASFYCPLCKTSGDASQLIGALNPENKEFWNTERIANFLMQIGAKHGAGPLIQALEYIGLLPKLDEGSKEQQESAARVREAVFRATMSAVVETAFDAAARYAVPHFEKFGGIEAMPAVEALKEGTKDNV